MIVASSLFPQAPALWSSLWVLCFSLWGQGQLLPLWTCHSSSSLNRPHFRIWSLEHWEADVLQIFCMPFTSLHLEWWWGVELARVQALRICHVQTW